MVLVVTFLAVLFAEHLENALFIGIGTSIYYALRRAEGFKLRVLLEGEDDAPLNLDDLEGEDGLDEPLNLDDLEGEDGLDDLEDGGTEDLDALEDAP